MQTQYVYIETQMEHLRILIQSSSLAPHEQRLKSISKVNNKANIFFTMGLHYQCNQFLI